MYEYGRFNGDMGYIVHVRDPLDPNVTIGIENPWKLSLPEIGTLKDYYTENYEEMIIDSLSAMIEYGKVNVGKVTAKVPWPRYAHLNSAYIERLEIMWERGCIFKVDVIIPAIITISAIIDGKWADDTVEQWYRYRTICTLDCDLQGMDSYDITIYDKKDRLTKRRMSEYLIPIIRKEDMDAVAEGILKKYYPEALERPMRVDGHVLAERMGLGIQYARLTMDHSAQGQFHYEAGTATVFDEDTGEERIITIPAKTSLIDREAATKRGDQLDDAIVHECVHCELHGPFLRLQWLYSNDMQCISSPVVSNEELGDKESPLYRIEKQAAQLTPRLRMPASTTRVKINELLARHRTCAYSANHAHVIKSIIVDLAEFYGVSRQAAKIRMIELGYEEAEGACNYMGGRYVPEFTFAPGSLSRGQTFTISIKDAADEYMANPRFQELIDTGRYQYIEGHFCVRDPRYIGEDRNGKARLTNYAREHADKCCLKFEINGPSISWEYPKGVLYRKSKPNGGKTRLTGNDVAQGAIANAETSKTLMADARRISQILRSLPATFADTLVAHMTRLGITREELEERSCVSGRTLTRMRNEEEYPVTLGQAVALCIGMNLEPELSDDLIGKCGYKWKSTQEHMTYRLILRSMYMFSIHECNAVLQVSGIAPLVKTA